MDGNREDLLLVDRLINTFIMQSAAVPPAPPVDHMSRDRDMDQVPAEASDAKNAVRIQTTADLSDRPVVNGYDFNQGIDYDRILQSYLTTGFQATNFALAVQQVNQMVCLILFVVACHLFVTFLQLQHRCDEFEGDVQESDVFIRRRNGCTIFLGYTSNIVSSGLRESIRFLVQHRLVDCLVTTAGGVEEDIIKCLGPTLIGDFNLSGATLRQQGVNRIGNLLVPNSNYCKFQDWLLPLLDQMREEQEKYKTVWSPSTLITRLGEKINDDKSICYWAAVNKIPIFCPALTDGSLGDVIFFHSFQNPGLVIDVVQDIRRINRMALKAQKSGMIIIGGGVVKHHIANANLMVRNFCRLLFMN